VAAVRSGAARKKITSDRAEHFYVDDVWCGVVVLVLCQTPPDLVILSSCGGYG
jgi:hypothetical protein